MVLMPTGNEGALNAGLQRRFDGKGRGGCCWLLTIDMSELATLGNWYPQFVGVVDDFGNFIAVGGANR